MVVSGQKLYDCTGIGLATYDFTLEVATYPAVNTKHTALHSAGGGGGPVPTAAVTMARLGSSVALVTTLGEDYLGRRILAEIKSYGIDISGIRLDAQAETLHSHILVEAGTGKRTVVQNTGDLPEIQSGQVPEPLIRYTRSVTLDSRPSPAIISLAERAKKRGARIMLDAGSVHEHTEQLLPLVDYLIVSASFVEDYFGHADYGRACKVLIDRGAVISGVTLGADGSILCNGKQLICMPAFPVKAVDTTGAGDMYHGALLYGILKGWPLEALGQFAGAVAAIGIQQFGSGTRIPTLHEVTLFLQEHEMWQHPVILKQRKQETGDGTTG